LYSPPWTLPGANTTLTTTTAIRHMSLESNNLPTDKLLYSVLTSNIYQTGFVSNLNLFLNLPVDLPVALLLLLGV